MKNTILPIQIRLCWNDTRTLVTQIKLSFNKSFYFKPKSGTEKKVMALIEKCLLETVPDPDLSLFDLSHITPFQMKVYKTLLKVPRGEVISYSELARLCGQPGAVRAVATALAKNPLPVIFPCHRVIKKDGSIGGFSGGVDLKKYLVDNRETLAHIEGLRKFYETKFLNRILETKDLIISSF